MSGLIVNTIRPLTGVVTDIMDLGQGQMWYNLLSERQSGVVYRNTTGRSILVNVVETGNGSSTFEINDEIVAQNAGNNADTSISVLVPNNSTYMFTSASGILHWSELR